jgi:hypothetical protein
MVQRPVCFVSIVLFLLCMVQLGHQRMSLPRLNLDPSRQLRHCAAALIDGHWSDSVDDRVDQDAVLWTWKIAYNQHVTVRTRYYP